MGANMINTSRNSVGSSTVRSTSIGGFPTTKEGKQARDDALLVFKSILKLSMRDVPANTAQMNAFAMRTKVIGLELILTVLGKPGPTFLDAKEPFIDLIKNSLCDGLLKYSVSSEP